MGKKADDLLRYSIFDPTGNITALVESPVPVSRQPEVAAGIMARHPEVEQVGFVSEPDAPGLSLALRMAGGEFCGNASLCAAALLRLRKSDTAEQARVRLRVSGADEAVEVRLRRDGEVFTGCLRMPRAEAIRVERLSCQGVTAELPLVCMKGIWHLVIEASSPFFVLSEQPKAAESAVKRWCTQLGADGLGLMFLQDTEGQWRLTPLVYVPGSDTIFWENSCASGSAATALLLARRCGNPTELSLHEPGGILRAACDPASGETWLYGQTRRIFETE